MFYFVLPVLSTLTPSLFLLGYLFENAKAKIKIIKDIAASAAMKNTAGVVALAVLAAASNPPSLVPWPTKARRQLPRRRRSKTGQ